MRNRAKCKLCNEIIESTMRNDYVSCKCGEIAVDGGQEYSHCAAKNWPNFLRIDDSGNEIEIKVVEKSETPASIPQAKLTRQECIELIKDQIRICDLDNAERARQPLTNYDLGSVLYLLLALASSEP